MEYVTECNENKCLSALEAESLVCMEDYLTLFPSNIHTRDGYGLERPQLLVLLKFLRDREMQVSPGGRHIANVCSTASGLQKWNN